MSQETSEPPLSQPVLPGEARTDDERHLKSEEELWDIRNELTAKSQAEG
jgi:hypothetical protein